MPALSADNLFRYAIQLALVIASGGLALKLLRVEDPRARLAALQGLLLAGLLLPVLQPSKPGVPDGSVRVIEHPRGVALPVSRVTAAALPRTAIGAILAAGCLVRLLLFGAGLLRLRGLRRRSVPCRLPVPELPGARAEIRMSSEVPGPATFGFLRPVILLPARWAGNEAVLLHELIHVRRGDWLWMTAEEMVRALLWFHPAIWWLLGQIQLAREEAVDREVVRLLSSREHYLETLLAVAAAGSGLDLAPAPLFLRKRHLRKRVAFLMKEVTMSRIRIRFSMAALAIAVLASAALAVSAWPLQAQTKDEPAPVKIKVKGSTQAANLVKKVTPVYPVEAKKAGIQGVVHLNIDIEKDGKVTAVRLVDGDPILAESAIQAVKQWEYRPTLLNGEPVRVESDVEVNFTLRP